jgi:hypothetical protein
MIYLVFSEIPLENQLRSAEKEKWASPFINRDWRRNSQKSACAIRRKA